MRFNRFTVQFSKPTWAGIKELAQKIGIGNEDLVVCAVQSLLVMQQDPDAYLTHEGQKVIKSIAEGLKDPMQRFKK